MTVLMTILLRPDTVRMRFLDRALFLARLDQAAAKLRYRQTHTSDGAVIYEPKALIRTSAMWVVAELDADEAVLSGPNQAVKRLKAEIEKA